MNYNNKKIISYNEFKDWHTANETDNVVESIIKHAYSIYKKLYNEKGKEYADEKICGHKVWNHIK